VAPRPNAGHGLLILEVSRSHTTTHHSRYDFSGRVISPSQRPLPDNKQHSQQANIHAPGGIRTHDLSRRAAADPPPRPRGHWDRHSAVLVGVNSNNMETLQIMMTKLKSYLPARDANTGNRINRIQSLLTRRNKNPKLHRIIQAAGSILDRTHTKHTVM